MLMISEPWPLPLNILTSRLLRFAPLQTAKASNSVARNVYWYYLVRIPMLLSPACLRAVISCVLNVQPNAVAYLYGGTQFHTANSPLNIASTKHVLYSSRMINWAFHGLLNPLSSRTIVKNCVLPILMYRSESWIMNQSLLSKLESFYSELRRLI